MSAIFENRLRSGPVVLRFRAVHKDTWILEPELLRKIPMIALQSNRDGTIYAEATCSKEFLASQRPDELDTGSDGGLVGQ